MATSTKAVSRSKASKGKKRGRLSPPTIARRFRTALARDQYVNKKWAKMIDQAWTENDDLACLIEVERDTLARGIPELNRLNWERLLLLRERVLQRRNEEFFLGELDNDDPDFLFAAAALETFSRITAERFPERAAQLQALKNSELTN